MSRIAATFDRLRAERRAALVPFVTAGDPTPAHSPAILRALVANGADVIEGRGGADTLGQQVPS